MDLFLFLIVTFLVVTMLVTVVQVIISNADAKKGKTDIRLVAQVKSIPENNTSEEQYIVQLTWAGRPATDPSKQFKVLRFKPPGEQQEVCLTKDFTWLDTHVRQGDALRYQIITQGEHDSRYGIVHQKTSNIVWVKIEAEKME